MVWLVIWLVKILSNQIANHTLDDCKSNSNKKGGMIGDFFQSSNQIIPNYERELDVYQGGALKPF